MAACCFFDFISDHSLCGSLHFSIPASLLFLKYTKYTPSFTIFVFDFPLPGVSFCQVICSVSLLIPFYFLQYPLKEFPSPTTTSPLGEDLVCILCKKFNTRFLTSFEHLDQAWPNDSPAPELLQEAIMPFRIYYNIWQTTWNVLYVKKKKYILIIIYCYSYFNAVELYNDEH